MSMTILVEEKQFLERMLKQAPQLSFATVLGISQRIASLQKQIDDLFTGLSTEVAVLDLVRPSVRLRKIVKGTESFVVLNDVADVFGIACSDIEDMLPSAFKVFNLQDEDGVDADMQMVYYADLLPLLDRMFRHYAEAGNRGAAMLSSELKYEVIKNRDKWKVVL